MADHTNTAPGTRPEATGRTRREAFAAIGATALTGIAAAAFASPDLALGKPAAPPVPLPEMDARLIELSDQLAANYAQILALETPFYDVVGGLPASVRDHVYSFLPLNRLIRAEIGNTPATTTAGIQAKARACMEHFALNDEGEVGEGDAERMSWSLCKDLLARS